MTPHLFIVASAFQALNAAEARHHFGLDPERCELVVLEPRNAAGRESLEMVVSLAGWPSRTDVGPPATSFPRWLRRVLRGKGLGARAAGAASLFIGDYRTQIARHAAHFHDGEVVVLDDGGATKLVAAHRRARAGAEAPRWRLSPQVSRTQEVVARLLGLRLGDLPTVHFFSMYEVEVAPPDRLTLNRYPWLQSRFADPGAAAGALFLGGPLVEMGVTEAAVYEACVASVARTHPGLRYKPHLNEDPARVRALAGRLGLEVVDLATPVEVGLLMAGSLPSAVYSFYSTALESLPVVFGDRVAVRAVEIQPGDVAPRWRSRVAVAYDMLRAAGVEVVSAAPAP